MNDDLPRDPLVDETLGRYVTSGAVPDDWVAISARADRRRPRGRGLLAGGIAVAACSALAVFSVALFRDGGATTAADQNTVTTENPYSDLAGAQTSAVTLELIGPGDYDPSNRGECYASLNVRDVSRLFVCAPRAFSDRSGIIASTRSHAGDEVTIYGVLPADADGVRIPGDPPFEIDGRLFSAVVSAPAPRTVQFTSGGVAIPSPSGNDVVHVSDATSVITDGRSSTQENPTRGVTP